jgi:hypothetical protein
MGTPLENSMIVGRKEAMVAFLRLHSEYIAEAFTLAVSNKQPYCWRAAWLLQSVLSKNDERLVPHINSLIQALPEKKDGHQRELLKLISLANWDEEMEGELFELCQHIWVQLQHSASLRVTAMEVILRITHKYPELKQELALLLADEYIDTLTPGIRRSLMKRLNA